MHYIGHRESELAGTIAIDIDIQRGIVLFLLELQIAEKVQLCQLRPNLFSVGVGVLQVDSLDVDQHGRRRAEAHYLRDDVSGFERDVAVGELFVQVLAEPLAQTLAARRIRFQRHLDDGVLRAGRKQMDQIHRVAGWNEALEIAADRNTVLAGSALDYIQRAKDDTLRLFDPGSGGSTQANPEQGSADIREEFRSQARNENVKQSD